MGSGCGRFRPAPVALPLKPRAPFVLNRPKVSLRQRMGWASCLLKASDIFEKSGVARALWPERGNRTPTFRETELEPARA